MLKVLVSCSKLLTDFIYGAGVDYEYKAVNPRTDTGNQITEYKIYMLIIVSISSHK
jgi:hypothetical protein